MPDNDYDPIDALRQLIQHEVDQKHPNVGVLRKYIDALQAALAQANELSVSDMSATGITAGNTDLTLGTGGDIVFAGGGAMSVNDYNQRHDQARDNHLGALEDIARRAGPDPLAALLQSWETVLELYLEEEHESLAARVRHAVEARLPQLPTPRETI